MELFVSRRGFTAPVLGLALALCAAAPGGSPPLLVTQVVELTGFAAALGDAWRNGVEMAVLEINAAGGLRGRLVQVMTFDAQSASAGARAAMAKALEADALAVLGPVLPSAARGAVAVPRSGRAQLLGAGTADLSGAAHACVFHAVPSDAAMMARLAGWLRGDGHAKRLAILSAAAEPWRDQAEALARAARAAGLEIAAAGSGDPATDVPRLLRAAPDTLALLLPAEHAGRAAALARRESASVALIGGESLAAPHAIELAAAAAEGLRAHVLLGSDPAAPELLAFQARYAARFKEAPSELALAGYIALIAVRAAVDLTGSTDARAVCEALPKVSVLGSPGWDASGDSRRPSWIVQVRGGRAAMLAKLGG